MTATRTLSWPWVDRRQSTGRRQADRDPGVFQARGRLVSLERHGPECAFWHFGDCDCQPVACRMDGCPRCESEAPTAATPISLSAKRCPDRRCSTAVHTWTWLTDDGDPTGPTYICRPGAPT